MRALAIAVVSGALFGASCASSPTAATREGRPTCPVTNERRPHQGAADGLPQEGDTTLAHVEQVLSAWGERIRADFPAVQRLSVEPRNGDVWRGRRGRFTVRHVADFLIAAHLATPAECPPPTAARSSYDGVPLFFTVG